MNQHPLGRQLLKPAGITDGLVRTIHARAQGEDRRVSPVAGHTTRAKEDIFAIQSRRGQHHPLAQGLVAAASPEAGVPPGWSQRRDGQRKLASHLDQTTKGVSR